MRLLITGDWHLDEKKPRNRTDTFVQDQQDKIKYILDTECFAILQPGDFCNTSKLSDGFKTFWINQLQEKPPLIITIPGQHDMRYHTSDIRNTPMGVLNASGVITVATEKPMSVDNVSIYGAGWEGEIPEILDTSHVNILLIHKTVSDVALWPGHQFTTPKWLLKNTEFDIIVCGDNHKSLLCKEGDRFVVNCGSIMRSNIDQGDHKPIVYIYDTESRKLLPFLIPVKPFKEIMNVEEAEREKEKNAELDDFIEGLSETNIDGLDFKKNLLNYIKENEINQGTINIINEIMEVTG